MITKSEDIGGMSRRCDESWLEHNKRYLFIKGWDVWGNIMIVMTEMSGVRHEAMRMKTKGIISRKKTALGNVE